MRASTQDLNRVRLIGILTVIITGSVLALGFIAMLAFNRAVEPELVKRTQLIGSIFRSEIQRMLDLGIPFEVVAGLDRYLAETLDRFGEVDRISVANASGAIVAEVQRPTAPSLLEQTGLGDVVGIRRSSFILPILAGNEVVGQITVEVSPLFVETRLRSVFLDVAAIALVATLIALELALAVVVVSVGKPLDRVFLLVREQRDGSFQHCIRPGGLSGLGRAAARLNDQAVDLAERLAALPAEARARIERTTKWQFAQGNPIRLRLSDFNDIRLSLFLFSVATEISSSFLPLYARAAARPDWLSPELAAAAPLAVYLSAVAALSPFGALLARRFGPRRLFLASTPPTALTLLGMALADTLLGVSLWRGATAIFYAVATIACHQFAIRSAGKDSSARSSGAFVGAVYGGVLCGSVLGGIVAGQFGFEVAIATGAAIAVLSGVLGCAMMLGTAGDPVADARSPRREPTVRQRAEPRFLALLAGVAAPANATTAIFIWYLTPLMLAAAGYGPADIARVVMLYYLATVMLGPSVTRLADGRTGPVALVVAGVVLSGSALLTLRLWDGLFAIAVAVVGVGLGHTLIRVPQYAIALRLTGGSEASLGALRLVERLGALTGLALSATFLRQIGAEASLWALGIVVLTGGGAFAIMQVQRTR